MLPAGVTPLADEAQEVTVIVNARAGSAGGVQIASLEQAFSTAGVSARVVQAAGGVSMADLAAEAAGRGDIVVAAGGDGTVGTVAGVAVESGATFGVIPLGTLNHFARDVGIPAKLDEAVKIIAGRHVRALDVGEVNGRVFVNNSSIGLYPRLVWERHQEQRRGRPKWIAFAIALVRTWRRYRSVTVRLLIDGHEHVHRTPFVFIGNNEYVAEGLQMGGRGTLEGGQLSIYVAPHCGKFEILALPFQALAGRLATEIKFQSFTASEVQIETPRRLVSVAMDGEVTVMRPALRYRIRSGALRALVPASA